MPASKASKCVPLAGSSRPSLCCAAQHDEHQPLICESPASATHLSEVPARHGQQSVRVAATASR